MLSQEQKATLGELIVDLVKEIHNPVEFIFNALNCANQYAIDLIQLLEHYQHCYPTPSFTIPPHLQSVDINFIKTDFIKLLWSLQAGSEGHGTEFIIEISTLNKHYTDIKKHTKV